MVVYESKSVFWQALVVTIVIFAAGIVLGYYLENSRVAGVEFNLLGSEVNLLDEQMRAKIIVDSNISCDLAIESTFAFADKIYDDAVKMEQYDSSGKFTNDVLFVLHKRYDLLRMMLWDESIKLKSRCGGFHTVVYFFDYSSDNIEVKSKQTFFSNLLLDVKYSNLEEVLLIPIAGNLGLASVDLAMENYHVSKTPAVLIDEKKIVDSVVTLDEMNNFIFSGNKTAVKK